MNNIRELTILIVEDDEDDVLLIKEYINEGMTNVSVNIDTASNYEEGLACINKKDYDICLFDYKLGAIDGLDLLHSVRSKGFDNPIVFLTGSGDEELAVKAMKAGATDYLVKSKLSIELLCNAINYAIELNKEERKRKYKEKLQMENIAEKYKEVHKQKEMFYTTLNLTEQAIVLADVEGEIQYINSAANELIQQLSNNDEAMIELSGLILQSLKNNSNKIKGKSYELNAHYIEGTKNVVAVISNIKKHKPSFSRLEGTLTKREIEVLELLKKGLHNKEIASKLTVSPNTVKRHLDNMYCKLEVSTRTELLAKAYQLIEVSKS